MRPLLLLALLAAACNPNTTRPSFAPSPAAKQVLLAREPAEAIAMLAQRLKADSIPVARVSLEDAYLETPWMDSTGHVTRARPIGLDVVRLRAWADPAKVGSCTLIVELSWRPRADPSLPQRELDRDVPATHPIAKRVDRIVTAISAEAGGGAVSGEQ